MAWTSDTSDTSDFQLVRNAIGDINERDQLMTDEQIDFALVNEGNVVNASIACCRWIIALLARDVNRSGAGINASVESKSRNYRDLLDDLMGQQDSLMIPSAGGLTIGDMDSVYNDNSFPQLPFTRDRWRNK